MYLGIDIGGTKTLVAALTNDGVITESTKFQTPSLYPEFLQQLAISVASLTSKRFVGVGVGAPGRINRKIGEVEAFGNLDWRHIPIVHDIKEIVHEPVVVENDANLAGLSEAMLIKQFKRVLYVTISTGIGTGVIVDRQIDPAFADSEGGEILLEYRGKIQKWESFASGKAIFKKYGLKASEINDQKTWHSVAHAIAIGLFDLITFAQPDAVVIGGGVGAHLEKFHNLLVHNLKEFETPITPIPPLLKAQRPEEAVIYGCYDLARSLYA